MQTFNLIKVSLKTFFLFLFFIAFSVSSNASSQYSIKQCESCNTYFEFQEAAKQAVGRSHDMVLVYSINHAKAKMFIITYEYELNSHIIQEMPLPEKTIELLQVMNVYKQMEASVAARENSVLIGKNKAYASSFVSKNQTLFQSSYNGNGCGSPSHWSYNIPSEIRDAHFERPCNNHDVCYDSGARKAFCDLQFEFELNAAIDDIIAQLSEHFNAHPILFVHAQILLQAIAEGYLKLGTETQASLNAYCAANSGAWECSPEVPDIALGEEDRHTYTSLEDNYASHITCLVRDVPDGNGGTMVVVISCYFVR